MGWREIKERNAREKAAGVVHVHPEHAGKARAVVRSEQFGSEPCGYARDVGGFVRQELGLAHGKDWRRCTHPTKPLRGAEYVCPCDGCGPGCDGYAVEPADEPVPAAPRQLVRHLAYHIWPAHGGVWRENVAALVKRIGQFNGTRTVGVAIDSRTDHFEDVRAAFAGVDRVEFIVRPNDPKLREVATWEPVLSRALAHAGADDVTFYGHAKGVSRIGHATVPLWRDAMYEACLDAPEVVAAALARHPLAGPFKKTGQGFSDPSSMWHYSGTFFWMRNRDVAAKDWRKLPREWFGVESWPGVHFRPDEAGELLVSGSNPTMDLYDARYWARAVAPALRRFRASRAARRTAVPADGLKIELGGGRKGLGAPWVNVDIGPAADVQLDLSTDPLPWPDESASAVYSSHCFEHVAGLSHLLKEVVRVCRVGATVEVRVPHWGSDMAMCFDHRHTISETQVRHWVTDFPREWFGGYARRLALRSTEYVPHSSAEEAAILFPHFTRRVIA